MDIYLDMSAPPPTSEEIKLLVVDTWTPPFIAYRTMRLVPQRVGIYGTYYHYWATGIVQNFDSTDRVILASTNPRIGEYTLNFDYSATVQ